MNAVVDIFNSNGDFLLETYIGCTAYIDFTQKFIKLEIPGVWHSVIDFEKVECDNANRHYKVYKKEVEV